MRSEKEIKKFARDVQRKRKDIEMSGAMVFDVLSELIGIENTLEWVLSKSKDNPLKRISEIKNEYTFSNE